MSPFFFYCLEYAKAGLKSGFGVVVLCLSLRGVEFEVIHRDPT